MHEARRCKRINTFMNMRLDLLNLLLHAANAQISLDKKLIFEIVEDKRIFHVNYDSPKELNILYWLMTIQRDDLDDFSEKFVKFFAEYKIPREQNAIKLQFTAKMRVFASDKWRHLVDREGLLKDLRRNARETKLIVGNEYLCIKAFHALGIQHLHLYPIKVLYANLMDEDQSKYFYEIEMVEKAFDVFCQHPSLGEISDREIDDLVAHLFSVLKFDPMKSDDIGKIKSYVCAVMRAVTCNSSKIEHHVDMATFVIANSSKELRDAISQVKIDVSNSGCDVFWFAMEKMITQVTGENMHRWFEKTRFFASEESIPITFEKFTSERLLCSNPDCPSPISRATRTCGGCLMARYCGEECQAHAWRHGHAQDCSHYCS